MKTYTRTRSHTFVPTFPARENHLVCQFVSAVDAHEGSIHRNTYMHAPHAAEPHTPSGASPQGGRGLLRRPHAVRLVVPLRGQPGRPKGNRAAKRRATKPAKRNKPAKRRKRGATKRRNEREARTWVMDAVSRPRGALKLPYVKTSISTSNPVARKANKTMKDMPRA